MEAVQELNIKPRNWKDLMTDEPFVKSDLIMLQDPDDEELKARRDISNFTYLKEMRDEAAAELATTSASSNIRVAPGTAALFKDIEVARKEKKKENAANMLKARAEEDLEMDSLPDLAAIRKLRPTMEDLNPGAKITDSKASQSFTSSGVEISTQTSMRLATVDEIREARWRCCRKVGKKGYVQIQTNCGNINLEVQSDIVPMTSENFLKLCASNAYAGTKFHRLIPGFMVQGGDTTKGDGTGGKSCWGEPFKVLSDTLFHTHTHPLSAYCLKKKTHTHSHHSQRLYRMSLTLGCCMWEEALSLWRIVVRTQTRVSSSCVSELADT